MTPETVTKSELFLTLNQLVRGLSAEQIRVLAHEKYSALHVLSRLIHRYDRAYYAAEKFNLIGVGRITFAEHRTASFCRRAGLVVGEPYVKR